MKKYIFLIFLNIIINYSFSQSRVDTYYSSGYIVDEKRYNAECYIFYQYDDNRLTAVGLMANGSSSIDGTILYAVENTYETISTVDGIMSIYKCTPLNTNSANVEERYLALDETYKNLIFIVPDKLIQIFRLDRLEDRTFN